MTRPPGIVLFTIGYGAGLAIGLSHLMDPGFIALVLLAMTLLLYREWWAPLLPGFAIAWAVGVHVGREAVEECAARLPLGEQRYVVRSIDPGEGSGRVEVLDRGCSGSVLARWPRAARFGAGVTLNVTGRWAPTPRPLHRPDGMLLISAADSPRGLPASMERVRTGIVRSTALLFGPRAPLANALIGGWRGELDPALRTAFASAGLMHLLSISGFHVAWFGGWVLLLLGLVRMRRHPAEMTAAIAVLGYCALLGWPPAAFRAATMLLMVAACRWRQRQVRFDALLGASALISLAIEPWSIVDPGMWLSISGLTGVVIAVRWSDRAIGTAWWTRSLASSVGALILTAPLAAGVFGQVAPVGAVLSVAGMPLMLLVLPAVFAAVLLHPLLPVMAGAIAASGNVLLVLLERFVRLGAQAPGAASAGETGWRAAVPWLAVLVIAGWVIHGRSTLMEAVRRFAWAATAAWAFTLTTYRRTIQTDDHSLTLLFMDVGQGDGALIRTPAGHWIEVDAGPAGEGRDAGRSVIAPLLAREGVARIDLFVLSHAHRDHVGGGASVLERIPIAVAIEPGELFADSAYDGWLAALAAHHTRWRAARRGAQWTLDGVTFRVLHPPTPWERQGEDLNEDSIVLEVAYGGFRALLMGDAGLVAESAMAAELRTANVLKVGHHGSRTATGEPFLAAVRPQAAVVSVGRNNYGHPAPETLDRLAAAKAAVWRTDIEGTVRVTTDGQTFTVKGARSATTFGVTHRPDFQENRCSTAPWLPRWNASFSIRKQPFMRMSPAN